MSDHAPSGTDPSRRLGGPAIAGCLFCTAALSMLVLLIREDGGFRRFDFGLLSLLTTYPVHGTLRGPAGLLVHLGDPLLQVGMASLACLTVLLARRRAWLLPAFALVVGADLTTELLKHLLAHPRHEAVVGYRPVSGDSFPSGHATAILSMAFAFLLIAPRSWRPAIAVAGVCMAIGVGVAVIVLHRHYPSDVLGGFLVASAWFCAVQAVVGWRR